jgi:hypothetical protein
MMKTNLKQQRLAAMDASHNRRDKKKSKGSDEDEKMEDIAEETTNLEPKELFGGTGSDVTTLFKKPDNERWKKLLPQVKQNAKAYSLSSRFVPKSEASDGISCHDDFAGTAKFYMTCHQVETSTSTQAANAITVDQWTVFFKQLTSGPVLPVGKTKLPKNDPRRRAAVQFFTNLCHLDPTKLFADSIKEGTTVLFNSRNPRQLLQTQRTRPIPGNNFLAPLKLEKRALGPKRL